MKTGFFSRIAIDNIRKNPRLYVPRILAETGLLACFYIAFALACDKRLAALEGGDYVTAFMAIGTAVLGGLSLILILYVNSFLMKRRKSEYGLYNVLGMEKKHIARVLFCESMYTSVISAFAGICGGVLCYKLCSMLICRLLKTRVIAGFYYINLWTLLLPTAVFFGFDLLAYGVNALTVAKLKPVELLSQGKAGEKEPKVKWLMLLLGVFSLGAGYCKSITVKGGLGALTWFFPAVILVIVGTYFLFITGTTFVLKCLKKNKNYYYTGLHMPAVSGLLFRMKQNAVGLASVAILSTGILVMISTTVSLYAGMQQTLESMYPAHLYLSAGYEEADKFTAVSSGELAEAVSAAAEKCGISVSSLESEKYLSVSYLMKDESLLTKTEVTGGWDPDDLTAATICTFETYNELMAKKPVSQQYEFTLAENEIAYCPISGGIDDMMSMPQTLTIAGKTYTVKANISYFPITTQIGNTAFHIGIIVADETALDAIYRAQKLAYGEYASEYSDRICVSFDDEEAAAAAGSKLEDAVFKSIAAAVPENAAMSCTLDTKWAARASLLGMYGAFLFLGIILGIVCLFSTILIIYYKQISEGYEDRQRYQIMQKIGMEPREVRQAVRSQMVMQFFLPLITAGIHTAAAFPMLLKLLSILMLPDNALAILCTLITFAVFAAVYVTVYAMTSRTYYKIVR